MKNNKWLIIGFLVLIVFFVVGNWININSFFILNNVITWSTKFILPWLFLYWFIRLTKIIENKI